MGKVYHYALVKQTESDGVLYEREICRFIRSDRAIEALKQANRETAEGYTYAIKLVEYGQKIKLLKGGTYNG